MGALLAYWMADDRSTSIVAMTAAYAGILIIFVGSGLKTVV